jgi:acetolactate synthase-1/2/3 large subunit
VSDSFSDDRSIETLLGTNADRIVHGLQRGGVQRLFGMPGGGSSADLIEAARRIGLPFSLTQTEAGSAFMATAQAEITGKPGACVTTLGPGAASVVNGVANAHLDRVPLIVLTDCHPDDIRLVFEHQNLLHDQIFSSLVKWSARMTCLDIENILRRAIETVAAHPCGPVHLDLSSTVARAAKIDRLEKTSTQIGAHSTESSSSETQLNYISASARHLLERARRPIFLLGMGSRTARIASVVQSVMESHHIPALVTYKAKGVVPDKHVWFGGVVTNGALERNIINGADLLVAIGLDPVELLPRPWTFQPPVISVNSWRMRQRHIPVAEELIGDIPSIIESIAATIRVKTAWTASELTGFVQRQRAAMRPAVLTEELLPHEVVEIVAEYYEGVRATVDAGAHMFPVMSLWPAREPCGMLISGGLSTMGFAVPAAIGAGLLDRSRATIAFTGDGGLLMCLGELCTASREGVPIRIIVFDDGVLSLIKIKQIERGYSPEGTTLGHIDWESIGEGFGIATRQARTTQQLRSCLAETHHHHGPVLIAATVSDQNYQNTLRQLRG